MSKLILGISHIEYCNFNNWKIGNLYECSPYDYVVHLKSNS